MGKAKTDDIAGRNALIIQRYTRGDGTLQAIGDDWGITRERVRQILVQAGITVEPLYKARMAREQIQRDLEELRHSPPATVCSCCLGLSFRRTGGHRETVRGWRR